MTSDLRMLVTGCAVWLLVSCSGGSSAPPVSTAPPPPPPPPPPPTSVTISGAITFDSVPLNTTTNGLDYANTQAAAAKGVVVEAVDNGGAVLASDITDDNGNYSVSVNSSTDVRIQAKAQLLQTTGVTWNFQVTDNTNNNALYVLAGSLTDSGTADSTRNLNAGSGWGGAGYTATRAAAPFAILAPIYDTVQKFSAVDSNLTFPDMEFRWSVNNRPGSGNDPANGEIGTSFYSSGVVYLLGDENTDTDEYDSHVVVHEWGHYFEDNLSRSDSVGGAHGSGDRLDPRVAFGEGWGNALSGMILDDSFYRDSSGNQQANGFFINVENNSNPNTGWYNEGSTQSILYDIYDSAADGADNIALGLGPIYDVLTAAPYTSTPFRVTIFSFLDELKSQRPGDAAAIDALSAAQDINGTGPDGSGETNDAGLVSNLPVHKSITVNGGPVQVCSVNDFGTYNKIGIRKFTQLQIATTGPYTVTMTKTSGPANRDPDFRIWNANSLTASGVSPDADAETWTGTLQAGDYTLETYDFWNVDGNTANAGDSCYNLSVTG